MRFERQSGVFLHHSSLPSPHGVGDLGAGARDFLAFLDRADQSLWQFCPLGPTSGAHGNSPYQAYSAFAGNALLIDLRDVVERGYLTEDDVVPPDDVSDRIVRYDLVTEFKERRLRSAFERFEATASESDRASLDRFRDREAVWLDDFTLFMALKAEFDGDPWYEWPEGIRTRESDALERYREKLTERRRYHEFVQWLFDEQWQALRTDAADRGIDLVGDLPIYVALDSADVWTAPDVFELDDDHQPVEVAGVPPGTGDDGQRWGTPVYDWDYLRETGYEWWIDRFERLLELVDVARIDHFKGFDEFWAIPADSDDPGTGHWRQGPGAHFFETVREELGDLPFFVEDLGFLDESVFALRDQFDLPGMRVPQYTDWCVDGHMYQPSEFPRSAVGYTATHDTDTIVGYYRELPDQQRECLDEKLWTDGSEIHWDVIEAVWNSEAVVAMTTVQDLLGLDSDARFNVPGTATGNWQWRVTEDALDPAVADRLAEITDRTIR